MGTAKVVVNDANQNQPFKTQSQSTVLPDDDDFPEFDDFPDEDLEQLEEAMAKVETEYMKKKGTRVMFFDIETMVRGETFSDPEHDQVIQISCVCAWMLPKAEPYYESHVFTLGTCLPIEDVNVVQCYQESYLLKRWRSLVIKFNPDIMSGYYIHHFDLRYLIQRSEKLDLQGFAYLGRRRNRKVRVIETEKPHVRRISGRRLADLYRYIKSNYKLPSYSLNAVALHFLGKQKDDVNYREIPYLQKTSSTTRQKLAKYCLKDSLLVLDLFQKLDLLTNLPPEDPLEIL